MSVSTDGVPYMTGKNKGLVTDFKRELSDLNAPILFHCVLHQQNFRVKSITFNNIMEKVICIVNYIRANATKHRQFQNMFRMDDELISVDLRHNSKVRCLLQSEVLVKTLSLRAQIINFSDIVKCQT